MATGGIFLRATAALWARAGGILSPKNEGDMVQVIVNGKPAIEGRGLGGDSFGVSGQSDNVPVIGCHLSTAPNSADRTTFVARTNSANIPKEQITDGFGVRLLRAMLAYKGWSNPNSSELEAFDAYVVWDDVTAGQEKSSLQFFLRKNGQLVKVAVLDCDGNLKIKGALLQNQTL